MKKLTLLLTLLILSNITYAKDIDQAFKTYGAGSFTCKEYLNARRTDPVAEIKFRHWLAGYFTAFNIIVPNTYDIMGAYSFNKSLAWLDQFCVTNENENTSNAVATLTTVLYPNRVNISPNIDNEKKWKTKQFEQNDL